MAHSQLIVSHVSYIKFVGNAMLVTFYMLNLNMK